MLKFPRVIALLVFLFAAASTQAQNLYYVVIGGFANEGNAQKFSGYVRSNHYDATYDFNSERKLSYVYILKTADREEAYAQTRQLQSESEFKDAWVFNGLLDRDINTTAGATPVDTVSIAVPAIQKDTTAIVEATPDSVATIVQTTPEFTAPEFDSSMVVKGKLVRFVIQDQDGKPISGASVHHVDYKRGRDIATFAADKYLDMLPPPTANNPMTVVCAIFGYKESVKEIDYRTPGATSGVVHDSHGAWVIPYTLEPLNKGDVSVMYRVSFYKDAVVMLPPAKNELDQLVNMMTVNPNYRIKIHGHCNGTNSRRIIALGPTKNYFEMKGSDERKGSAKELSRLRAEAVRTYLADHGIDVSRTEIYAWGGLNMLVSETSTSAKLNDRIEIEILGDK